jgi:hypothetical protein
LQVLISVFISSIYVNLKITKPKNRHKCKKRVLNNFFVFAHKIQSKADPFSRLCYPPHAMQDVGESTVSPAAQKKFTLTICEWVVLPGLV